VRRFVRGRIVLIPKFSFKIMANSNKKLNGLVADLGNAIRNRRQAKNLSQESLAEIADFDRTYISLLERGERNPSFTNLCRVAAALKTTPSELLKGISYGA
jgi:ribosome-binding protein aMBF1 (putative translation factor)